MRSPRQRAMAIAACLGTVVLAAATCGAAQAVQVTEFRLVVAGSKPLGIATGSDGNVWFTEVVGSRVGKVTPEGRVTDFSTGSGISTDSRPWSIATGPDGNLWFTEESGRRIGRLSTQASGKEFPTGPTTLTGPRGITAGPDGAVWFTDDPQRIGRISTAGAITEFSAGISLGSRPLDIAAGSDGNLWFTELAGNKIARITPLGAVTEFSTGITPNSQLSDITAGPDGNLWFTEDAGNRIGRITPAGIVTEFSEGISPGAQPRGITAGPDGNLWFAEEAGNRLGRITPDGAVTEFKVADGAQPLDLTTGEAGDLWFTEGDRNAIGRLALDPSVTTGPTRLIGDYHATLDGTAIPFSSRASTVFEVGRTAAYGAVVPARLLSPGRGAAAVSAVVDGLPAGTTFHYRLDATNAAGTTHGPDRTFTTTGTASPISGGGTPTTVDRTAPKVTLPARPRVRAHGRRVALALRCPLTETLGCRVVLRLETARRIGRHRVLLATATFRLRGGQRKAVSLALTRRGRTLARTHHRLTARLTLHISDAAGNRKTTVHRLTLKR
jgi:streptogramin lyase